MTGAIYQGSPKLTRYIIGQHNISLLYSAVLLQGKIQMYLTMIQSLYNDNTTIV